MYTVLLVCDNQNFLLNMQNIVDWKEFGFKTIGCAGNDELVKSIINKNPPDLIIYDAEMSNSDNLFLLNTAKNIVTVFISESDNFSYIRGAFQSGVFDCLLKPFTKEDIECLLKRAFYEIKKRKEETSNILKFAFYNYLYEYAQEGENEYSSSNYLKNIPHISKSNNFVLGVIKSKKRLIIPESKFKNEITDFYSISLTTYRYAFLSIFKNELEITHLVELLTKFAGENDIIIGISLPFNKNGSLHLATDQANIASFQNFITEENKGAYIYNNKNTAELCSKIRNILFLKDMKKFLKELKAELIYYKIGLDGLIEIYNEILNKISSLGIPLKSPKKANLNYLLKSFNNISDLISFLYEAIELKYEYPKTTNALINEVLKYISENYNSNIMLQDIAKKLNVNQNYLSMLFKKECGISYRNYLIDLRLKKAEKLLKETKLSIDEICKSSGYEDCFHFSKMFKKYKGLSPANYRKNFIQKKLQSDTN